MRNSNFRITNEDIQVQGRIVSISTENVVAAADQVFDDNFVYDNNNGLDQSSINNQYLVKGLETLDAMNFEVSGDLIIFNNRCLFKKKVQFEGDVQIDGNIIYDWSKSKATTNKYGAVKLATDINDPDNDDVVTMSILRYILDNDNTGAIDSLKELLDYINEHAGQASDWYTQLVSEITGIKQTLNLTIQPAIDDLSRRLATEITNRTNGDNALSERITTNTNNISSLQNSFNALSGVVTGHTTTLADHESRIAHLEECCQEVQDFIANFKYAVTLSLSEGVTASDTTTTWVRKGGQYTNHIYLTSADYENLTIHAVMGGTTIVPQDGYINIANVTGNIAIAATATPVLEEPQPEPTIIAYDMTLTEGDVRAINPRVDPSGQTYTWSYASVDPTIASVDSVGNVTAVSEGVTSVLISANSTQYHLNASITVTVNAQQQVVIDADDMTIQVNESRNIGATVTPSDYTLKYSSRDTNIATVNSSGVVTGVSEGEVRITIGAVDPVMQSIVKTKTITVTVTNVQPEPAVITASDITVKVGESKNIGATVSPSSYSLTYSHPSAEESIATLSSSGNVLGVSVGTTQITITANDTAHTSRTITVTVTQHGTMDDMVDNVTNIIYINGDHGYSDAYQNIEHIGPVSQLGYKTLYTRFPATMTEEEFNGVQISDVTAKAHIAAKKAGDPNDYSSYVDIVSDNGGYTNLMFIQNVSGKWVYQGTGPGYAREYITIEKATLPDSHGYGLKYTISPWYNALNFVISEMDKDNRSNDYVMTNADYPYINWISSQLYREFNVVVTAADGSSVTIIGDQWSITDPNGASHVPTGGFTLGELKDEYNAHTS